jgi:hypothetical protein
MIPRGVPACNKCIALVCRKMCGLMGCGASGRVMPARVVYLARR